MSRASKDPVLTGLANELRTISFDSVDRPRLPFDNELREMRSAGLTPRCYHLLPDGCTFGVRLYLGGAYRRLGYTKHECVAAKFADLATRRFWNYRWRGGAEVTEAYLNFNIEDSKDDVEFYEDAIWLLDRIQKHLESTGVLPDPRKTEAERQRKQAAKRAARTLRGEILHCFGELSDRLQRIEERLNTLSIRTVRIVDAVDTNIPMPEIIIPAPPHEQPGYIAPKCGRSPSGDDTDSLTTALLEIECVARDRNNVFELTPKNEN